MKMDIILLTIALVAITLGSPLRAQQTAATSDDGRKVLLNKDGTWQYAKDSASSSSKSSFTFRKSRWGLSMKSVKSSESTKPIKEDEEIIAFRDKVSGDPVVIVYVFAEEKLVRARYSFATKHTNKNDFISDFKSLKTTLTEKYGESKKDNTIWKNDLYKTDYDQWGFAVGLGHLMYYATWETEDTDISLVLSGENYDISLVLEYSSKQFAALEDTATKKKTQSEY